MKNKIKIFIIGLIFLLIAIYGGYNVIITLNGYNEGSKNYEKLEQYINIEEKETNTELIKFPIVDFDSLENINSDVIAWIYMENLDINYPVVQGEDNNYYLKHLIDGKYNDSGSIFLDYRNKSNLNNKHTIIYGHNMLDGTMFTNLTKYNNQEFYEENPYYLLVTPTKNYEVQVFAGYIANVEDNSWKLDFETDKEFENWIEYTKNKSSFKSDITPRIDDNVITLSTCSFNYENARFVLVGVINEYKN